MRKEAEVLVIGAGAAGLAAARSLHDNGIMVGWCGGTRARQLSMLSHGEVVDRALHSLARQLHMSPARMRVKAGWTHDWQNDPYARGAYSYQKVGGADAPAALARSVQGTLFFAGEATETSGATGTVHGAIFTGWRAAAQVIRQLRQGPA
jgi:monoamine oxidase